MVGISKRFEKRTLKSHGLAGCGKSVFSISVNAAGVESKGGNEGRGGEWLDGGGTVCKVKDVRAE
jgi:hypothetical protein